MAQHPSPPSPPPAAPVPYRQNPTWALLSGPRPQGHVRKWLGPASVQGTGRGTGRGEIREGRGALSVPSDAAEPLGPGAQEGTWHPWGLGHWNAGLTLSSGLQGLILGRPGPPPPLMAWSTPLPCPQGVRPRPPSPRAQHGPPCRPSTEVATDGIVGSVSDLQGTQAVHTGWLRPGLEPASLRGHPRGGLSSPAAEAP